MLPANTIPGFGFLVTSSRSRQGNLPRLLLQALVMIYLDKTPLVKSLVVSRDELPRWLQTSPPQPVTGTPRHWHAILNGNVPFDSVSHWNSETSEASFSLSDGCDRHLLPDLSGRPRSIRLIDSGVQSVNIIPETYHLLTSMNFSF